MDNQFRFKKKSTQSLMQTAYNDIRDAIIRGNLQPGTRLNESEIADQMGISRGPIREAIRLLEQEGLVISHPYRATIVAEVSEDEVKKVFVPIRRIIETYASQIAAKNLNDEDFKYLYTIIDKMKGASINDNLQLISELDLKLHRYIVEKSGVQSIISIWNSISGKIHIRFLIQGIKHDTFQAVVEEHIEYIELLREGDEKKIEKHLNTHIT